jgi:hypothetical protein
MAIVTGAGENYLSFTGVPSTTAFTMMAQVYLRSDANDYSILFGFTGTNQPYMGINIDGITPELGDDSNDRLSSIALSVGTWNHLCWVRNAVGDDVLYVNRAVGLSTALEPEGAGSTSLYIGRFGGGAIPYNIGATRLDGIKIYNAALSSAEVTLESYSISPVRHANLWAWLPTNNGGVIGSDWSGNGRNFTINGTIPQEDPAPVSWGGSEILIPSFGSVNPIYYASPLGLLMSNF